MKLPEGETLRCRLHRVGVPFVSRVQALLQWFVFRKVCLPAADIEESQSCIRAFIALVQGTDSPSKEQQISMRMRLYDAAKSLCRGLPLSCFQSLRSVGHLNSAYHLSLREFSAKSCGLQPTKSGVLT